MHIRNFPATTSAGQTPSSFPRRGAPQRRKRSPSMTPDMRVVIVGCGRIAGGYNDRGGPVITHAAAYRQRGAALVGCCDTDSERAQRFAQRWRVQASGGDLKTILERTEPHVVSVCTPPEGRTTILETVLATRSVRAVLVEKPIAAKASEAEQVRDL